MEKILVDRRVLSHAQQWIARGLNDGAYKDCCGNPEATIENLQKYLDYDIEHEHTQNMADMAAELAALKADKAELMERLETLMDVCQQSGIKGTTSAWYSFGECTANQIRWTIARVKGEA